MTQSPKLYPAKPDPTAPNGWITTDGMFYQPSWGDRLIEIDGQTFIEVIQVLPGATHAKPAA